MSSVQQPQGPINWEIRGSGEKQELVSPTVATRDDAIKLAKEVYSLGDQVLSGTPGIIKSRTGPGWRVGILASQLKQAGDRDILLTKGFDALKTQATASVKEQAAVAPVKDWEVKTSKLVSPPLDKEHAITLAIKLGAKNRSPDCFLCEGDNPGTYHVVLDRMDKNGIMRDVPSTLTTLKNQLDEVLKSPTPARPVNPYLRDDVEQDASKDPVKIYPKSLIMGR